MRRCASHGRSRGAGRDADDATDSSLRRSLVTLRRGWRCGHAGGLGVLDWVSITSRGLTACGQRSGARLGQCSDILRAEILRVSSSAGPRDRTGGKLRPRRGRRFRAQRAAIRAGVALAAGRHLALCAHALADHERCLAPLQLPALAPSVPTQERCEASRKSSEEHPSVKTPICRARNALGRDTSAMISGAIGTGAR
jgi:hypothetical protein